MTRFFSKCKSLFIISCAQVVEATNASHLLAHILHKPETSIKSKTRTENDLKLSLSL